MTTVLTQSVIQILIDCRNSWTTTPGICVSPIPSQSLHISVYHLYIICISFVYTYIRGNRARDDNQRALCHQWEQPCEFPPSHTFLHQKRRESASPAARCALPPIKNVPGWITIRGNPLSSLPPFPPCASLPSKYSPGGLPPVGIPFPRFPRSLRALPSHQNIPRADYRPWVSTLAFPVAPSV